MAVQISKSGMITIPASLPANIPFAIDTMRVQGPARLLLRQRYGSEMRTFLEALPEPIGSAVRVGMATDIGTRPCNEDSAVAVVTHFGGDASPVPVILVAVADGLGSSDEGHIASGIAIQALTESVLNQLATFSAGLNGTEMSANGIEGLLLDAVRMAHFQIKAGTADGASTLTCALIVDRTAYLAHIGDSRAYLLNDHWQDMEQITHDHRRERDWQRFTIATNGQIGDHPRGHVLTRVLGKSDDCEVDLTRRTLAEGSSLFLCSNGIWENVSPEALFAIIHRAEQPQDACEALLSLAMSNNAHDDMTAVLVEMP